MSGRPSAYIFKLYTATDKDYAIQPHTQLPIKSSVYHFEPYTDHKCENSAYRHIRGPE